MLQGMLSAPFRPGHVEEVRADSIAKRTAQFRLSRQPASGLSSWTHGILPDRSNIRPR